MRAPYMVCILTLALALGGCAALRGNPRSAPTPTERGHVVALRRCAACHAVEASGVSPSLRAPGFASREFQHTTGLEDRLADLTRLGHYGMPPTTLTTQQVADLVAYVGSLVERDGPRRARR